MTSDSAFYRGTALLTAAACTVKLIGAMFKIPLNRLLGPEGAGHFAVACNLYLSLLNITATGIPLAMSSLICEANTLGQKQREAALFRSAQRLLLTVGGIGSCLLFFGAGPLARWMRDPGAIHGIRLLAPAVLFSCVSGAFRGFFQGRQQMGPTAAAQVLEASSKLLLGLAALLPAVRAGWPPARAAGAATLGMTVGAGLAAGYFLLRYHKAPVLSGSPTLRDTYTIVRLAVPITVGTAGTQLIHTLSGLIILGRLQDALRLGAAEASALYGIYTMAHTLCLLPPALIQPLCVSIIPAVTEAVAQKDPRQVRRKERTALSLAACVAVPAGIGLSALCFPIQQLLYGYDAATLSIAGPVLAILGPACACQCLLQVTNAIMQARGRALWSAGATAIGGITSLAATYLLTAIPRLGIHGAALGALVYPLLALACNALLLQFDRQEKKL